MKVLIVEDEPNINLTYAYALGKQGYEVTSAATAEEALEKIKRTKPQVILLDMLLRGTSGLDMLKELELKKWLPKTKVIVISNFDTPRIVDEAAKLGVDRYLVKAKINPQDLSQVIDELGA
ncbi:MAG TPA: response regulator [Candidatus Saccharimonadales bacterium]|nr:response regulator [Candidatus Saccharimonadales bacterium]